MKISLKSFVIIICVAISGVVVYQFYWLNNLYRRMKFEMDIAIIEAMKTADMKEMQYRFGSLEKQDQLNELIAIVAFKSDRDLRILSRSGTTKSKGEVIYSDSDDITLSHSSGILQAGLSTVIINAIHQSVDNILFSDIQRYDSLLHNELLSLGVEKEFYIELIKVSSDSILCSSLDDKFSVRKLEMKYDYFFGNEYTYRLWIDNPYTMLFRQMTGILLASLVILLLLACLFYLLAHTIWRQKTLEEMKSSFINNMTHELRTPLSVSYAAIDSLLVTSKANNKEHRDKYLVIAKDQISHLSELTEQIFSMSYHSKNDMSFNPEKIELKEMIESIFCQQSLTTKKKVVFEIQIEEDFMVIFDRMHLANILNNVIENSIKYSGSIVNIVIGACFINASKVEIRIEDKGVGIEPEKQKYIFDKFYRVPTGDTHNVKGYGLGLFYVKKTLEQVGGSISLKSRFSEGSTFTIILPQSNPNEV